MNSESALGRRPSSVPGLEDPERKGWLKAHSAWENSVAERPGETPLHEDLFSWAWNKTK